MRRHSAEKRLRILVMGDIVRGPMGGICWHYLQYAVGLHRLGHHVTYVEDSGDGSWCCYDPTTYTSGTDPSYGLQFADATFERSGMKGQWAYYDAHTSSWIGPAAAGINDVCGQADALINISGANLIRPWLEEVPVRIFVDTDPVFTQIRRLTDTSAYALARQHTHFFTFGETLGQPSCCAPGDGLPWQRTRQPVVLDMWPVTPGPSGGRFTTVMHWQSFSGVEHEGVKYGLKAESFPPFHDLPMRVSTPLEMAVGGKSVPRAELSAAGWRVVNPLDRKTPWDYQRYIQDSKAEFTLAKHGYVLAQPGWFSERSAVYLASGRPVVVQETGFSTWLPGGLGVLPFLTPDEAVDSIDRVNRDYPRHCRAARALAEEYFDSASVLTDLLDRAMQPRAVA